MKSCTVLSRRTWHEANANRCATGRRGAMCNVPFRLVSQLEQLQQTVCRLPHGELSLESQTEQFVSHNAESDLLKIFEFVIIYLMAGNKRAKDALGWRQCVINVEVLSNLLNMQPTY
ncbi:hypothetical protein ACLKA6_008850 [Drosophila palustris]